MIVEAQSIREGDRGPGWVALEDALKALAADNAAVTVRVQYEDGGISDRIWDDPTTHITITRPLSDADALDAIAAALSGREVDADAMSTVAEIVRTTGRDVEDVA